VANTDTIYTRVGTHAIKDRRLLRSREVAYQSIKHAILSGVLGSEAQLIEERLGAALEVSRTPVREALAILEHEGLIESIPHKGLFVRQITVAEFLRMFEAAEAIEPTLAREAARQATEDDLAAMEALLIEAEQAIPDDIPRHLAACRGFQQWLGQCADNQYLTAFLISIEEKSDLYLINTGRPLPVDKMVAAVTDRRAILAAVRDRDPEAAAQAARAHTREIRIRWREMYANGTSQDQDITIESRMPDAL
jgi:DNA-binding GntR family transcriptional regulator